MGRADQRAEDSRPREGLGCPRCGSRHDFLHPARLTSLAMPFSSVEQQFLTTRPTTSTRNKIVLGMVGIVAAVLVVVGRGLTGGKVPENETKVVSIVQTASGQDLFYATGSGSAVVAS